MTENRKKEVGKLEGWEIGKLSFFSHPLTLSPSQLLDLLLLAALPALMFCIIPAHGIELRVSWQLVSIWLAGMAFVLFLRSWWHRVFFLLALCQVIVRPPDTAPYMTLLMIAIFLVAIEGYSRMDPDRIMNMICAAALLLIGWIWLQRLGLLSRFDLGSSCAGPFNINAASAFIGISLSAFYRPGGFHWLPFMLFGLAICHSTTGVIAALVSGAVFLALGGVNSNKIFKSCILALLVLGGVFLWKVDSLSSTLQNDRWQAWKRIAWTYRSECLGRGLGSFREIFPIMTKSDKKMSGHWMHAHNEYLQVGFEMGVQTMALIVAYLTAIAARLWRGRKTLTLTEKQIAAGMAATATACAGWHVFHIAPLALLGCAWMGMIRNN